MLVVSKQQDINTPVLGFLQLELVETLHCANDGKNVGVLILKAV